MMDNKWYRWLNMQLGASLEMLKIALENATPEMWDHSSDPDPFWLEAFHVIYYIDYYFSTINIEQNYDLNMYEFPIILQKYNISDLSKGHQVTISRNDMLKYLSHARNEIRDKFEKGLVAIQFAHPSRCFEWLPMTKGELILYNIRHIMEHTAILNQILKKHGLPASEWQMASSI